MKRVFSVIPVALLAFAVGCAPSEKKDDVPPPPKASSADASAPAPAAPQQPESAKEIVEGYQKGLVGSVDKARLAQARTDLGAIKDAVKNYQVDNGKFPASLDEIKSYLRGGTDLGLFNYDPANGNVTIK
jgi:hypothetical protein